MEIRRAMLAALCLVGSILHRVHAQDPPTTGGETPTTGGETAQGTGGTTQAGGAGQATGSAAEEENSCVLSSVDLVVAAEGFYESTAEEYKKVLDLVKKLGTQAFSEGSKDAKISFYHYDRLPNRTGVHLDEHINASSFGAAMDGLAEKHHSANEHNLVWALDAAVTQGFARWVNQVKDLVLFITDGADKRGGQEAVDALKAAELAALHKNVTVMALGVGPKVVKAELEAIAGDPARVLVAADLDALLTMEPQLCAMAAEAKPELTCIAHAKHFDQGFTLSDCQHHCQRAEASNSFADPEAPCSMVGVDVVVSAVGFSKATDAEFAALVSGLELILAQTSLEDTTTKVALYASHGADAIAHPFSAGMSSAALTTALRESRLRVESVDLAAAIDDAGEAFLEEQGARREHERVLILLTDGRMEEWQVEKARNASANAAAKSIKVFAIGMGDADAAQLEAAAGDALRVIPATEAATGLEAAVHSTLCRRVMEPAEQADCLLSPYYTTKDDCVLKCSVAAKNFDPILYDDTPKEGNPPEGCVWLFDKPNYIGAEVELCGVGEKDFSANFSGRTESLKLAPGVIFEAYEGEGGNDLTTRTWADNDPEIKSFAVIQGKILSVTGLPENCIWLFQRTLYNGHKRELCGNGPHTLAAFDNQAESLMLGASVADVALYDGTETDGSPMATYTANTADLTTLNDRVSTVRINPTLEPFDPQPPAPCVWVYGLTNYQGDYTQLCGKTIDLRSPLKYNIRSVKVPENYRVSLFREHPYDQYPDVVTLEENTPSNSFINGGVGAVMVNPKNPPYACTLESHCWASGADFYYSKQAKRCFRRPNDILPGASFQTATYSDAVAYCESKNMRLAPGKFPTTTNAAFVLQQAFGKFSNNLFANSWVEKDYASRFTTDCWLAVKTTGQVTRNHDCNRGSYTFVCVTSDENYDSNRCRSTMLP